MIPFPKTLAVLGLLLLVGVRAAEPTLVYSLVPPVQASAGAMAEVQVVVLNQATDSGDLVLSDTLQGTLTVAGASVPTTLTALPDRAAKTVPGGTFLLRRYRLDLPAEVAAGMATLELVGPNAAPLRTAFAVTAASQTERQTPTRTPSSDRPTTNLVRPEPVMVFQRVFENRIAPHDAVYFIGGADAPSVKFQFSFKYKLLDFDSENTRAATHTLQFGFTQRSLWDVNGDSSPFYDTSYMPELIYESLTLRPQDNHRWIKWLGFQAAFKHESNGRDGNDSRSLNTLYFRPVLAFGNVKGWHLLMIPEVLGYVTSLEDNPDLKNYRGYGRLITIFGRDDGPSLMVTAWGGKDFNHQSVQLDLTLPIRTRLLSFETYFLIQYFNGYGESLRDYRGQKETVRAGFSLVR